MIDRGSIIELTVESSGFEGTSIARHEGVVVFVEGGVPGDRVRARVIRTKRKHVEARIVEVLTPSAQRTSPRCRHFGTCGGCTWQHVLYESQLDHKRRHVVDSLERIGGFRGAEVQPVLPSPEVYFYRNKLEFSFGDERWLTDDEMTRRSDASPAGGIEEEGQGFALGFHAEGRFDKIIDVDECHLQSDLSNQILAFVRSFALRNNLPAYSARRGSGYFRNLVIREGKHTGDVMANVVTFDHRPAIMRMLAAEITRAFPEITTVVNNINSRKSQVAVGEVEHVYYGEGFIREKIARNLFEISANSFFQTNTLQTERLYETARRLGELRATDVVYDLYCGTGTIALFIADAVRHVVGIELAESSIADARRNAGRNGIVNCEFVAGDLKNLLTKEKARMEGIPPPDILIVDPPRSGIHPRALEELCAMGIPRVVYVSCNPATLARDLVPLAAAGYSIGTVQPVDMFPHTYHIETVVRLQRPSQ